ncbi:MAG: hypothetical protein R3F53_05830 [Gammaproteobacteria bacterium]
MLGILGAVTLIWLLTALVSFLDARSEINKLLDAHLAQSASLLLVQSSSLLEQDDDDDDEILEQFDDIDTEHVPLQHRYSRQVVFQIWWRGRRLLLHSVHAPIGAWLSVRKVSAIAILPASAGGCSQLDDSGGC